jgi:DNA-binding GntR family transcriptional regulator
MLSANPLPRISLSHQIRDQILDRIVHGELCPGERLIELKIAAEFSTSQAPVREALRELEAMGVVETMPNKGARVRTISNDELCQLYDVRAQLESYGTQLAAENKAQIKSRLKDAVRAMKRAAREENSTAFASHNSLFHRVIVESSGNGILLELWENLNVQTRTMTNVTRSRRNLMALAESHLPIVEAIATGDALLAHRLALEHVLSNRPGSDNNSRKA